MEVDEELLDVAVHAALPHLVGGDLDEGVVTTLRPHDELEGAQRSGERARAHRGGDERHAERGEELVRDDEDVRGRRVAAIEVAHRYGVPLLSGSTSCIHSVFSSGFVESLWNWMPTAHCPDVTK